MSGQSSADNERQEVWKKSFVQIVDKFRRNAKETDESEHRNFLMFRALNISSQSLQICARPLRGSVTLKWSVRLDGVERFERHLYSGSVFKCHTQGLSQGVGYRSSCFQFHCMVTSCENIIALLQHDVNWYNHRLTNISFYSIQRNPGLKSLTLSQFKPRVVLLHSFSIIEAKIYQKANQIVAWAPQSFVLVVQ